MELQGNRAQFVYPQSERERHQEVRLQGGIVERGVNPLRPRLIEGEFALDSVHRVE